MEQFFLKKPCKECGGLLCDRRRNCLVCFKEYQRARYIAKREEILLRNKEWHLQNLDRSKELSRLSHSRPHVKAKKREYNAMYRKTSEGAAKIRQAESRRTITKSANLTSDYLRKNLIREVLRVCKFRIVFSDIPEELIEVKRLQLQLYRLIRQTTNS